jgi:CheY-like chemotaxis protein
LARCSINSPQDELEARGEPLTLNFEKGSRPVHGAGPLVVLVVEDEWLISDMIATHLREAGYLALEFATGDAAVSLLRQGGHFDILLTDINLGTGANGWDVADAFRTSNPYRPVIYVSGNPINLGRRVAGSLFFQKPYKPEDILSACGKMANDIRNSAAPRSV